MILLDCKPKTLKMPGGPHHHHSPTASLHWHAQRTCAIAVVGNGDGNFFFENGWDLCMLACVLRAARKMTHRDQQAAVLATLELARETTGWKIDGDVRSLQEFWRLAEHS
ncbi:putative c6 zinc finger domain-containing protein [Diplodia seriata]|uniref:Putative c6 zinc finger domain-containing protein n=1 Tax=Diplodia seriata TaxID=420778 RepID=A0A0G2DSJ4_9PEZI|nr:putative c6 zinc finger domain-containing protein [Diplodia seriata]